jgi:hypothetical protein
MTTERDDWVEQFDAMEDFDGMDPQCYNLAFWMFTDASGRWRWTLYEQTNGAPTENYGILAESGQSYDQVEDCAAALEKLKRMIPKAAIAERREGDADLFRLRALWREQEPPPA